MHAVTEDVRDDAEQEDADQAAEALAVEALATRLRSGAVAIAAATAAWLALVEEFDRRRGWAVPGIASCAHWLSWQCGLSPGTARDQVRVARALVRLPAVAAAFGAGRVSYAKVRAVVRVATTETEETLLQLAEHTTASQLDRVAAGWRRADDQTTADTRVVAEMADQEARAEAEAAGAAPEEAVVAGRRAAAQVWTDRWPEGADATARHRGPEHRFDWRDEGDGTVSLRLRLTAEDAAEVVAAVEHRAEVLTRRERAARTAADHAADHAAGDRDGDRAPADASARREHRVTVGRTRAFLDLVRAGRAHVDTQPGDPARREVLVRVDAAVLADDLAAGQASLAGVAALSPAQARRLACDAAITAVVVDGARVLACGRTRRFATAAQRRALLVRDGGCARPGCAEDRPERLHAHHLRHWLHGGRTDVDNLVLLCDRDHGAVHDLDLTLRRQAGWLVAHAVDGSPLWSDPPAGEEPVPGVDQPDLPLGWAANGERLDLRYAVGVLLANREALRRRLQQEQLDADGPGAPQGVRLAG